MGKENEKEQGKRERIREREVKAGGTETNIVQEQRKRKKANW